MASAIEELIGDHEIKRLMLFLQRPDRGHRDDPFHAELFESVDIGTKIQLCWKNAVPASVPRQKCNFAAFEDTENVTVGRVAERRLLLHFPNVDEAGHGIEPAATDNTNFRLRQNVPRDHPWNGSELAIIQKLTEAAPCSDVLPGDAPL